MPKVEYEGKQLRCKKGTNLRSLLLQYHLTPHNGAARSMNCFGIGTCGTCAVMVEGKTNTPCKTEKARLNFPPHKGNPGLRLACKVIIEGDLKVWKGKGFWGQDVSEINIRNDLKAD